MLAEGVVHKVALDQYLWNYCSAGARYLRAGERYRVLGRRPLPSGRRALPFKYLLPPFLIFLCGCSQISTNGSLGVAPVYIGAFVCS